MPIGLELAISRPPVATNDKDPRFDWFGGICPCKSPLGECRVHHRARFEQRPPEGHWSKWLVLAGRSFGKTRTGSEWVHRMAEDYPGCRIALVAATEADVRDVIMEGESGIVATAKPWFEPTYAPSRRRVTWPNGSRATTYSAEKPSRLRGPQHHFAWADELAAWEKPATYDMLLFGMRLGDAPKLCITTTPKATDLVRTLADDPGVHKTGGPSHDNRSQLPEGYFKEMIAAYEDTRLGQQEIHAQILELVDSVWFAKFSSKVHVNDQHGEYIPGLPVHLAIDCGTSRFTGAVWFQVRDLGGNRRRVNVFGDLLTAGSFSRQNAEEILHFSRTLPCGEVLDEVRLDPASKARTSIGVAAYTEYAAVFGSRLVEKWPLHRVVDGLDFMELMLNRGLLAIHSRCTKLIPAFTNYKREVKAGVIFDCPEENQHPHGDMMDALRGGIRDVFPAGRTPETSWPAAELNQIF